MKIRYTDVDAIRYVEMIPSSRHDDPARQVKRWKHSVDWWSGRIVSWVNDPAKTANAEAQVKVWEEKVATNA